MIPQIGLMIGAIGLMMGSYIITRMTGIKTGLLATVTITVSVLCMIVLALARGPVNDPNKRFRILNGAETDLSFQPDRRHGSAEAAHAGIVEQIASKRPLDRFVLLTDESGEVMVCLQACDDWLASQPARRW